MRKPFRIVRGSVRDCAEMSNSMMQYYRYREGWWWIYDDVNETIDGFYPKIILPYDPEGPFLTKAAAYRHLILTLSNRDRRRIPTCFYNDTGRSKIKRTMRTAYKILPKPSMIYKERRHDLGLD